MSDYVIETVFRVRNSKTGATVVCHTKEEAEAHIRRAVFEHRTQATCGTDAGTARMCLGHAEKMIALLMQYLMGDPAPTGLSKPLARHETARAYVGWLDELAKAGTVAPSGDEVYTCPSCGAHSREGHADLCDRKNEGPELSGS